MGAGGAEPPPEPPHFNHWRQTTQQDTYSCFTRSDSIRDLQQQFAQT